MHFAPNEALTDKIYSEIVSLIQEDDDSVPVYKDDFIYYRRTVKGEQYAIYARKFKSMEAPEEVLLNLNTMDHEFMDLRGFGVSPNHKILAYALDTDGSENYQIYFKDLETGKMLDSDQVPKAAGNFEWTNDSKSLYYVTLDKIHRSDKVYRHVLGSDPKEDKLVFHEADEQYEVMIEKSNSGKYIFIITGSTLTNETWVLDAKDASAGKFYVVHKLSQDSQEKYRTFCLPKKGIQS